jgi:hypothetical protein
LKMYPITELKILSTQKVNKNSAIKNMIFPSGRQSGGSAWNQINRLRRG